MLTLLTSAGRMDLLKETLKSFYTNSEQGIKLIIHEDGMHVPIIEFKNEIQQYLKMDDQMFFVNHCNQHKSIEQFFAANDSKYYLHLEDDWMFENSYDWISESIKILQHCPDVIKVLCREGSPHPCNHNSIIKGHTPSGCGKKMFGYLEPWKAPDDTTWHGFSWNPGVTRFDLLKKFIPFPRWEQELAENIYNAGFKVVELAQPIYKHIGDGRSTHV